MLNVDLNEENDIRCWGLEANGRFSVKFAWSICRSKKPLVNWGNGIWDPGIPSKISFFLWKLCWGRLPIDENISCMGILMPSKCQCCGTNPSQENIQHLFFEGEWATSCWTWFLNNFQMGQQTDHSFQQWLMKIFVGKKKEAYLLKFRRCLCAAMLWELWKARCCNKYGGKSISLSQVFMYIKLWIKDFSFLFKDLFCRNDAEKNILQGFGLENLKIKMNNPLILYWCRPPHGSFKLNVDGASRGNPGLGGGGGIIRNQHGDLIDAFSRSYGRCTNVVAEFNALRGWLISVLGQGPAY